jgi:hypothetical protein
MASSSERLCPGMAERERDRERGCARDTAELAATAGGKAVGDANTDKKTIQGCGLLQPRQERRRRREWAEWVTSRLGSLLGSHLHSVGFFSRFQIDGRTSEDALLRS